MSGRKRQIREGKSMSKIITFKNDLGFMFLNISVLKYKKDAHVLKSADEFRVVERSSIMNGCIVTKAIIYILSSYSCTPMKCGDERLCFREKKLFDFFNYNF